MEIKILHGEHKRLNRIISDKNYCRLPLSLIYVDTERKELVIGMRYDSTVSYDECSRAMQLYIPGIPFRFIYFDPVRHLNKQDHVRPLRGGLKISVPDVNGDGTLGLVVDNGGKRGFITAGHVVDDVGNDVFQPRKSDINDWKVGASTKVSNYKGTAKSDSAFVELVQALNNTPKGKIWKSSAEQYDVTGVAAAALNDAIFMQGAVLKTAESPGKVVSTSATVDFDDGGTLEEQVIADYKTVTGDSGAPVYKKTGGNNVEIIGLNVGGAEPQFVDPQPVDPPNPTTGEYGIVSPWANMETDLGQLSL